MSNTLDAQTMTVRCSICDWSCEGTTEYTRNAAARHRTEWHDGDAEMSRELLDRPVTADHPVATTNGGPTTKWTRDKIVAAIKAYAREHGHPPTSTDWASSGGTEHPNAGMVKRVFGSWGDAIEAAGFERPQRGKSNKKSRAHVPARVEKNSPRQRRAQIEHRVEGLPAAVVDDTVAISLPLSRLDIEQPLIDELRRETARTELTARALRQIVDGFEQLRELGRPDWEVSTA